jgi:hypothetical protein
VKLQYISYPEVLGGDGVGPFGDFKTICWVEGSSSSAPSIHFVNFYPAGMVQSATLKFIQLKDYQGKKSTFFQGNFIDFNQTFKIDLFIAADTLKYTGK